MNVLYINTVCGTGSTGRIVEGLYREAEAQGHKCMVGYGRGTAPDGINGYRIGSDYDMYFHALMTRVTDRTGFYSKAATKRFLKRVNEFKPDLIHLHNLHGYYINIELLFEYIKEKNIPVLWTLHDCWTFTGHCAHFDFAQCYRWRTGCFSCPQKREYPKSFLLDDSKNNYAIKKELFTSINNMEIITPSHWLAELARQSFLGKYPIKVNHNKIDTEVFKPASSNFRKLYNIENKIVILGVANVWTQRKGFPDFIKLSEMLDDRYKIILVGIGKKQKKKLNKNILGIEKTENAGQLAEIYTAADFYVNLTYEDTYPTTNLEAKACGTTVISYNTGGSAETADIVIEQGNLNGLIKIL